MSEKVVNLTDATFDEVINSSTEPVVVDFWAEWCGPCKQIAPILEEIAEEKDGKVVIAKVDVDENSATSLRFQVRSIPTMILFRNGEVEKRIQGAMPKDRLLAELGI